MSSFKKHCGNGKGKNRRLILLEEQQDAIVVAANPRPANAAMRKDLPPYPEDMTTWEEKRREILTRDNFTCQNVNCGQFNPELGPVQFSDPAGEIELHEYENRIDATQSVYRISQSKTGFSYEINIGDCWPVFPILQVHHKRYIKGKEDRPWDYPPEDLVTLCKKCHSQLHVERPIPVYSSNNVLLEEKQFIPVDNGIGRKHGCDEWTFISKLGGGEYVLSDIDPTITMVLFEAEDKEAAFSEAKAVLDKFIKQFFPRYHREGK